MQADSQLTEIGALPLSPGDPARIGPFPLRAVLGSGGMGRVYLGVAPSGYVAVKRIHPELAADDDFIARFGHELDNQARLPRAVSVPVLATDRTARPPWFAAEYIPGVTVQEASELAGGRLPVPQCRALLRELAARLSTLDGLGMVHRDIKPSNIMLTDSGVTLIDFGLAVTDYETRVTTTGAAVGTPLYMSPEQFRGDREITPAADVWALGGVLSFAAAGQPPFGDGLALSYRVISEEPDLAALRDLDPDLADIVARCLAKDPAERPSAEELADFGDSGDHAEQAPDDWTADWPAPVTGLIARRQSFATAPDTGEPDPGAQAETGITGPLSEDPAAGSVTGVTADAADVTAGGTALDAPPEADRDTRRRKRRRRLALIVIPVVIVVGTGIAAMRLTPFRDGPHGPGRAANVSQGHAIDTVSGRATPTPAPPRKSPKPSPKPTPTPSKQSARPATDSGTSGGTGQNQGTGFGGSGTAGGTSGGTSAGSTGSGSTSAGSTGGSGTGSSSGVGGGGTVVVSTSPARLGDASDGQCVGSADDGIFSSLGPCSGATSWRKTGQSGSQFEISDGSGDCLGVLGSGEVGTAPCAGSAADDQDFAWQLGATGSGGGTLVLEGSCLAASANGPMFAGCDSSDRSQLWHTAG